MLTRLAVTVLAAAAIAESAQFRNVVVRLGDGADSVESNAARILAERFAERAGQVVRIEREHDAPANRPAGGLLIVLGTGANHAGVARLMEQERALTDPEGFLLKTISGRGSTVLLAAGADSHGV